MNEEGAVARVVEDIRRHTPEAEILLVDSSTDRTPEIAREMGVRVLRQYPPQGYGPAMERALREASGQVVVTMDCDGTYPAQRIPELAAYVLEQGYDLVDGSRLEKKPQAMPWVNYLANWSFAALASVLFLRRITDLHSGMRAYSKKMIDETAFDAQGSALPVELLLKPLAQGRRLKTVFIDYDERVGETTLDPLMSAWMTFKRIMRCRFRGRR